jgi:hypothetical protein
LKVDAELDNDAEHIKLRGVVVNINDKVLRTYRNKYWMLGKASGYHRPLLSE